MTNASRVDGVHPVCRVRSATTGAVTHGQVREKNARRRTEC